MTALWLFNAFMRWLHVASAGLALGTTAVLVIVLGARTEAIAAFRPRLKKLVHTALGLLLLTGIWNYVGVAIPALRRVREQAAAGLIPANVAERLAPYHGIMGFKILLAIALITISILLLVPVPAIDAKRRTWLTVNLVIGLAIFLLGAILRRLW